MRKELINIQLLRAFAAVLVVFSHGATELMQYFERIGEGYTLHHFGGGFGVRVFFVISGFIMYYVSSDGDGDRNASRFIKARVLRIVPLYWFYTLLWVVAAVVGGGITHSHISFERLLTSIFFIPFPRPWDGALSPLLSLGWSLNYEMFFYVLFSFFLLIGRRSGWVHLVVFLLIYVLCHDFLPVGSAAAFWSEPIVLLFAFGVVLGALRARLLGVKEGLKASVFVFFFILIVVLHLLIDYFSVDGLEWLDLYVFPVCMVTVAVFSRDVSAAGRIVGFMKRVGDSSYSLYLSHPFSLNACILIFHKLTGGFGFPSFGSVLAFYFSLILIAVFFSFISFKWIERPMWLGLRRFAG